MFDALILGLWLTFLGYWFAAATRVKRTANAARWGGAIFRAALAISVLFLVAELLRGRLRHLVPLDVTYVSPIAASIGVAICALGVTIAIWARTCLGQNWGMPMSLRQGHELVTTGPYAYVRHPIYTGILLALVGTTLVHWYPRVVLLPVFFAYFVYAARVEERSMREQFPNEYPGYAGRTKMLIPFLF